MSNQPLATTELFDRYPALSNLPGRVGARILATAQSLRLQAGQTAFDAGTACAGYPFVLEGAIRVVKAAPSGRELPLYTVRPGETCVLSSCCLLGGESYSARGIAERDSHLVVMPRHVFEDLLAEPAFRDFVFHLFADRIGGLMALVEEVAFRRLDQRLAARLLGRGPELKVTHQQLADELGSVREAVSRLLKGFESQGLVRLARERIEVLDPAGLRRLAGD
ncbi:MAG TPA: Crp/Fnr family transcriptional regulator [Steroidobacteraceae bacterium]|nr:Crp/Fnr family transcriptional regulator [Steroidobacteraceae bacterium]